MVFPFKIQRLLKFTLNKRKSITIKIDYNFHQPEKDKLLNSIIKYKNLLKEVDINCQANFAPRPSNVKKGYSLIKPIIENNLDSLTTLKLNGFNRSKVPASWQKPTLNLLPILQCNKLQHIYIENSPVEGILILNLFRLKYIKSIICFNCIFSYTPNYVMDDQFKEIVEKNNSIDEILIIEEKGTIYTGILEVFCMFVQHTMKRFHRGKATLNKGKIKLNNFGDWRNWGQFLDARIYNLQLNNLLSRNKLSEIVIEEQFLEIPDKNQQDVLIEAISLCRSLRKICLHRNSNFMILGPAAYELPLIQSLESALNPLILKLTNCAFVVAIPEIVYKLRVTNIIQTPIRYKNIPLAVLPHHLIEFKLYKTKIGNKFFIELTNFLQNAKILRVLKFIQNEFPTSRKSMKLFLSSLSHGNLQDIQKFSFIKNSIHDELSLVQVFEILLQWEHQIKSAKIESDFKLIDINTGLNQILKQENKCFEGEFEFFSYKSRTKEFKVSFSFGFELRKQLRMRQIILDTSLHLLYINISQLTKFRGLRAIKIIAMNPILTLSNLALGEIITQVLNEIELFLVDAPPQFNVFDIQIPLNSQYIERFVSILKISNVPLKKLYFELDKIEFQELELLLAYIIKTKSLKRVDIAFFGDGTITTNMLLNNAVTINEMLRNMFIPQLNLQFRRSYLYFQSLETIICSISSGVSITYDLGDRKTKVFGY